MPHQTVDAMDAGAGQAAAARTCARSSSASGDAAAVSLEPARRGVPHAAGGCHSSPGASGGALIAVAVG
ncbi:hypothetical protein U9M48_029202 [Paspalum notatum var. saurae]|uniref:Uncharacterized protein n=1 Tax=Paspalum notatum var. saurae TaxID=547442 RepID=A0AAQ3TY67_PASNO